MAGTWFPEGYVSALNMYETQLAISHIKRKFEDDLAAVLNLKRVSAPLFVDSGSGLNDDLSGVERPVSFDIKETGTTAQVVHSLAKWKRMALHKYGFGQGEGLYTDMNAIRRDEEMDNLHSIYVDQWDWEKVLPDGARNRAYLEQTVRHIADVFCDTMESIRGEFPCLTTRLTRDVRFITTQELEDMYPDLSPKERESRLLEQEKTAFIIGIGGALRSGRTHDGRAPDYDDWQLNGDLLFWDDVLGCAMEVSSMGIRVDPASMARQLKTAGCEHRSQYPFHSMLLAGELPLTIGGGIGQSRTCMLMLGKAHVGEVQSSIWDAATIAACAGAGVALL